MSRTSKKTIALLMAFCLSVYAFLPGMALADEEADSRFDNEDLYFGALGEELVENVSTAVVRKGTFIVNSSCKATIDYENIDYVLNTIDTGTVEFVKFLVSNGSDVQRGDPIAQVKVYAQTENIEQLESQIASDEEMLESYIETNNELLLRYDNLSKTSAYEADRRVAKLLHDRLEVSFNEELNRRNDKIEANKAKLSTYKQLNEEQYITAPATGRVAGMNRYRAGDTLGRWAYMCAVYDTEHIHLRIYSGGEDLAFNQKVYAAINKAGDSRNVEGRVTSLISPSLSSNLIGTVNYVELTGDVSGFKVDEDVIVRYESQHVDGALLVPKSAVFTDSRGLYVFVYENGMQNKRYIVSGGNNAEDYWAVSGVEEGETVITK
ncbi:MAG: efflux RND transporter periplasmic adaptor subunit [Lachnospiraceae bacterium]|nr:efflux RND transporter periplasmic adaptor subunit [Lachnospiraceae bacterium]